MTGLAEGSMTARMKMTSQTRERRAARRLLATGLFLIAMTAGSYVLLMVLLILWWLVNVLKRILRILGI